MSTHGFSVRALQALKETAAITYSTRLCQHMWITQRISKLAVSVVFFIFLKFLLMARWLYDWVLPSVPETHPFGDQTILETSARKRIYFWLLLSPAWQMIHGHMRVVRETGIKQQQQKRLNKFTDQFICIQLTIYLATQHKLIWWAAENPFAIVVGLKLSSLLISYESKSFWPVIQPRTSQTDSPTTISFSSCCQLKSTCE